MEPRRILGGVRLALSVLFLWLVLGGNWVNLRTESFGVFHESGGAGFGIIAVILGAAMVLVCLVDVRGDGNVQLGPLGVGAGQLLLALALGSFTTLLGFLIVVHSGAFRSLGDIKGAGWGAAGACLTAYVLPQAAIMGIGFLGTASSTRLPDQERRSLATGLLIAGVAVAVSPTFEWFSTEERSWIGYDPGAPRMGFILLVLGGVLALAGGMRLRARGLAEPGGRLAHPHLQLMAGLAVIGPVAGWLLTGIRREDFSVGIGPWVALVAGVFIVTLAVIECTRREVTPG